MIHTDHLGGSNIITDGEGNIVQQVQYTPYGKISYELNLGVSVNYLYTGQQLDRETGLYYYNARYYDPDIGRFIQPDTVIPNPTDSQAYNRYAYCRNNPVMITDPSGHFWDPTEWGEDLVRDGSEDLEDGVRDGAEWVDDNFIQPAKDFVEDNRFVQDAIFFTAACMGSPVGLLWAGASSFNEARPYVGTAVGIATTVACGTAIPVAGAALAGMASGMVSAYLAGGTTGSILKAAAVGAAVGAATAGISAGASNAAAESIIANSFARSVTAGALSGAVSGGAYAAAYGGDVGDAMWKGAIVGAASAGAGAAIGGAGGAIASGMVSGGLSGALNDGDIVKGMLKGAAIAAAAAIVKDIYVRQLVNKISIISDSREFIERTRTALRNIYYSSDAGQRLVESTIKNDVMIFGVHDLDAGHAGDGYVVLNADSSNGIGPEHRIYLEEGGKYANEMPTGPYAYEVVLGHELGHNYGGYNALTEEGIVSNFENPIRSSFGVPLRRNHHGSSVY